VGSYAKFFLLTLCLCCAIFGLCRNRAQAQSLKWDSSWTPDDAFLSISINVQHALSIEKEDGELRKSIDKSLAKFGIDMAQLEQVQMILHGKPDEELGSLFDQLLVVKYRFSQPQKMEEIFLSFGIEELKIIEYEGKTYYKPAKPFTPSFFTPDAQTFIMGMESSLKQVMLHERSSSELCDRIQAADANDADLFITFVKNGTTVQVLEELTRTARGLPFDIADIAGEAKHGSVTLSLTSGKPILATIVTKDTEGAQRLQGAIDALVGLGKFGLPAASKALREQVPPPIDDANFQEFLRKNQEIGLKFLGIAETVLEGTETSTDENLLEVKVVAMGGIGQLVTLLGEQVQALFKLRGDEPFERGQIVEEFSDREGIFDDTPGAIQKIEIR
jgi:hypothetical protein